MNPPSLSLTDLEYRARELKRIGNSDASIRSTLVHLGADAEQIDQILRTVHQDRPKSSHHVRYIVTIVMISLVILACISLAVKIVTQFDSPIAFSPFPDPLSTRPIPTRETIVPTKNTNVLPLEGQKFFSIIWNLKGAYTEKAAQMRAAQPPAELRDVFTETTALMSALAVLDQKERELKQKYDKECGGSVELSNACKNLSWELFPISLDRDKAYSDLIGHWPTFCGHLQDYYTRHNVPYPDGACKYP